MAVTNEKGERFCHWGGGSCTTGYRRRGRRCQVVGVVREKCQGRRRLATGCSRGRRLEERLLAMEGVMEHERLGRRVGCGGCCERDVKGKTKREEKRNPRYLGLLFIL